MQNDQKTCSADWPHCARQAAPAAPFRQPAFAHSRHGADIKRLFLLFQQVDIRGEESEDADAGFLRLGHTWCNMGQEGRRPLLAAAKRRCN